VGRPPPAPARRAAAGVATSALLPDAWAALGGEQDLVELVTVTGDGEGLLPSAYAAMPVMLAAVAASTLAASVLDAARGRRDPSPVLVDAEHVALAARSERLARVGGSEPADPFAPLSRFWRTSDGWLRLHANYPWHRERALRVLACQDVAEDVREAILRRRGDELEDALAAADALGYAVRSTAEWEEHPQGVAVATLHLLDSESVGGAGRSMTAGRAAAGCRVLDLTRVIAGPVATRTLAAWGADVLRIDSPRLPEIPAQAVDMLSGKRSALLDLSEPTARTQLEELLGQADVLVQGYRPGSLARYGLAPGDLAERHPHLTTVALSAWSAAGPWAQRRGFDSLVQCSTGIADAEGADGEPGVLPAQVLDHATGYLAAAAALLALAAVARGEPPRSVRLSLAQTARWLTGSGPADRRPQRELRPEGRLVTLAGASRPVRVISPPGRLADLAPGWRATTDLGADRPAFAATGP
jgi:crotonobetainyl-CoA:carnitine CoA-transferase CaiB-like acyl-CoA transferase